jgi:hypothetical protein
MVTLQNLLTELLGRLEVHYVATCFIKPSRAVKHRSVSTLGSEDPRHEDQGGRYSASELRNATSRPGYVHIVPVQRR